jgi:hypothetical protein
MLPDISPEDDHRQVRALLEAADWKWLGRGDWSQVYASPDGTQVARVVPFDPAYALHVRTCVANPGVVHFQRIDWHCDLMPAGQIVVMERLWPADEAKASHLCCRLGSTKHLALEVQPRESEAWEAERRAEPQLQRLFDLLHATAAEGERTLGWFGGLDVRPDNVMQDASGQLKLVDPYFVAGPLLIPAMLEDIDAVARHYSRAELRGFLEIAAFEDERDAPGPVLVKLREKLADLEART